jgi:pimeloyl-ACP methyl ester carboxylesterase
MRRILRAALLLVLLVIVWQVGRTFLPEQERALRTGFKETVESIFPREAEQARARFGLVRLHPAAQGMAEVVLIHGLDDPGKVWMNLAPALQAQGFGVSVMEYPNDQPVHDSAREFFESLKSLSGQGVDELVIVAHSMGGLVSREMLSHPAFTCDGPGCSMPRVRMLIMVGTPNHGSHLARFRGLGELREQASRMIDGGAGWLDPFFDGAGEAGLDLMPGSPFLTELNSRDHPDETTLRIIAGVIGKDEAESLARLMVDAGVDPDGDVVVPLAEAIGDGLVNLESASLTGVPLWRVSGNHLSMIRNISIESERVPPAIPLILELLRE